MVRLPGIATLGAVASIVGLVFAAPTAAGPAPSMSPAGEQAAKCPMHREHPAGTGVHEDLRSAMESLDLTPAQRAALQALAEEFGARGVALRERAALAAADAMAIEPDDPRYATATDRASEAAAAIAADGVRLAAELRAAVHGLLTPDQRAMLRERRTAERKGWDDWRERHRPAK